MCALRLERSCVCSGAPAAVGAGALSDVEIEIIDGALDMSSKTVRDVMTPIDRVFGLSEDETLGRRAGASRSTTPAVPGGTQRLSRLQN